MAGLFLWLPVEVVIVVEVFVFSLILKMRIAKFNGDFLGCQRIGELVNHWKI
jgi:hypothetical protein